MRTVGTTMRVIFRPWTAPGRLWRELCHVALGMVTGTIAFGVLMIILALFARLSVGQMFIAGILPGLLLTAALLVAIGIAARRPDLFPSYEPRPSQVTMSRRASGA